MQKRAFGCKAQRHMSDFFKAARSFQMEEHSQLAKTISCHRCHNNNKACGYMTRKQVYVLRHSLTIAVHFLYHSFSGISAKKDVTHSKSGLNIDQ